MQLKVYNKYNWWLWGEVNPDEGGVGVEGEAVLSTFYVHTDTGGYQWIQLSSSSTDMDDLHMGSLLG